VGLDYLPRRRLARALVFEAEVTCQPVITRKEVRREAHQIYCLADHNPPPLATVLEPLIVSIWHWSPMVAHSALGAGID